MRPIDASAPLHSLRRHPPALKLAPLQLPFLERATTKVAPMFESLRLQAPASARPTAQSSQRALQYIGAGACGSAVLLGLAASPALGATVGGAVLLYGGLYVGLQMPTSTPHVGAGDAKGSAAR